MTNNVCHILDYMNINNNLYGYIENILLNESNILHFKNYIIYIYKFFSLFI